MHIISVTDFPLFCSDYARKCLILPVECSPQKSIILLEILEAEIIQAYSGTVVNQINLKWRGILDDENFKSRGIQSIPADHLHR